MRSELKVKKTPIQQDVFIKSVINAGFLGKRLPYVAIPHL